MFDDLVGRREDRGRETAHRVRTHRRSNAEVWRKSPEAVGQNCQASGGSAWGRVAARGRGVPLAATWPRDAEHRLRRRFNVRIPLRDGVTLAADLTMPSSCRTVRRRRSCAGRRTGDPTSGRCGSATDSRGPGTWRSGSTCAAAAIPTGVRALPQRRGGWLRRDPVGGGAIVVRRRCRHLGRQLPGADPMAGRAAAAAGAAGDDRRGHAVGPVRRGPDGRRRGRCGSTGTG